MKKFLLHLGAGLSLFSLILVGCNAPKQASTDTRNTSTDTEQVAFQKTEGDTIRIASDETEYEIIIIEPGFNYWLKSIARPEGYYSQSFLESRNEIYVLNWNQRVLQPRQYDPNLYELQINYDSFTDYGYEVNYKLYNYFLYFQRKYSQQLGPFVPRI